MFSREVQIYNLPQSCMTTAHCQFLPMKNCLWDQMFGFICCWLDKYSVNLDARKEGRKEGSVVLSASRRSRAACWPPVWVWVKLCCVDAEGCRWASLLWTLLGCLSSPQHEESCEWRIQGWTSGVQPPGCLILFRLLPQALQLVLFHMCSVFVGVHSNKFTLIPQTPRSSILNKEGKTLKVIGWSIYHPLIDQSNLLVRRMSINTYSLCCLAGPPFNLSSFFPCC